MIMYKEYLSRLFKLLGIEYGCEVSDILDGKNVLSGSSQNKGSRIYSFEPSFFRMATLGTGVLISADRSLHGFLQQHLKTYSGHWIFQLESLVKIEKELEKYGYKLTNTHHMLLLDELKGVNLDYKTKWFYEREIDAFYGDERFSHALSGKYLESRPDRIAVCAYDGEEIIAMAGCSEDAPHWQQIGIDVSEKYRGRGVGTYLVSLLTKEIIKRGDTPFYGTDTGNYHSMKIALRCGYKPTWVEIDSEKITEDKQ